MAEKSKIAIELELLNGEYLAKIKKSSAETKAFGKSAKSSFGNIQKSFVKMGAAAGGLTTIYKILDKSIKSASNLQEVTSKYQTVFTGNMVTANRAVTDLTEKYAMSTREAREYLSAVQDLLVPMGMNATLAADMSTEIVKLSADLGSFNNQPTEKVMQDITAALTGSFETMKKYGIVLNETVIKQEALNQGVWNGKGMIDAATKAQVAYSLMVKGSTAAIGDMERTSDSYANSMKRMKAASEDAAASIGNSLLPVLTKVSNIATAAFKEVTEIMKQNERHAKAMKKLEAMRARIRYDDMSTMERVVWTKKTLDQLLTHELYLEKQIAKERQNKEKTEVKKKKQVNIKKPGGDREDPATEEFNRKYLALQKYHNVKLSVEDYNLQIERERQMKAAADYEAYLKTKLGMDSVYYAGLQTVANTASVFMAQKNKKLFRFGQGLAIAQTIMNTQIGMIKAYAQLGPIAGAAGAAVVALAGALSIKRIASQKPPEFAVGSYSVPADMPAVIHKGEMILDRDTAQSARDLAESGPSQTNVYVDGQKLFDVSEMYRDEAAQNIGSIGSFPVESAY